MINLRKREIKMMKLRIVEKNDYLYNLEDEINNKYVMSLDFLDIGNSPKVDNYICMNEELLNPKYDGYSTFYTFGSLDSQYGKNDIELDDIDVIKLVMDEKEIYLKRLYG